MFLSCLFSLRPVILPPHLCSSLREFAPLRVPLGAAPGAGRVHASGRPDQKEFNRRRGVRILRRLRRLRWVLGCLSRRLLIRSDSTMEAASYAMQNYFYNMFDPNIESFASIHSPMQCMVKEMHAQCLQKHIHPETNYEYQTLIT